MDKPTDSGSKEKVSAKELDLTGLQNFNFASNWGESAPTTTRDSDSRHPGSQRRERRPDRRPSGNREDRSHGSERTDRRPAHGADRRGPERHPRREERPGQVLLRESPFEIQIFPEEAILVTLTNAMRHSLRTYELFEISRLVLEKPDRFQVSLRFNGPPTGGTLLFQSVPDNLPFLSEEAAVDHVFRLHLDKFFTVEEIEVEPPKGSFQFIGRCTLTGDYLGPPNYHRYQSILLQYHQERFPDMPFERFRSKIETVKDEEAVQKWLLSMTKQTRYRAIGGAEGEELTFDSPEEVRAYLLRQVKDKVVRLAKSVKFSGTQIDEIPSEEIRPYVLAHIEHQRRFPLDTANTLRGRLRRQHFFIYKKGSRGISFVCAVKRKFRQPGQVFSDTVQALISFLEENDQIHASQLSEKFLGLASPAEGEQPAELNPEDKEKVKRLSLDLRWLLSEGYVTEYSDGRLSVHPMAAPAPAAPAERAEGNQKDVRPEANAPAEKAAEVSEAAPAEEPATDGEAAAEIPEPVSDAPVDADASVEAEEPAPEPAEASEPEAESGEEEVSASKEREEAIQPDSKAD